MESVYVLADRDQMQEYAAYAPSGEAERPQKRRLYQSIHPKEYCTVPKRMHGTLGPAKVNPADHTNWLRKGAGHPPLPEPRRWDYNDHDPLPRKPAVYRQPLPTRSLDGTETLAQGQGCGCGGACACLNGGACECPPGEDGAPTCACMYGGSCRPGSGNGGMGTRGFTDSCELVGGDETSGCAQAKRQRSVPLDGQTVPITGLRSNKDFVKANIINATVMVPPPTGKADLDWTEREGYGKTPAYLKRVKRQVAMEQATLQELEQSYKGGMQRVAYMLDPVERARLLEGIKANWTLLNTEYMTQLKIVQDTFGQKNRKEWLERRLAELENDIAILERDMVFVQQ
ncbi:Enkurin superfamily protein [Giardia muris]|uniref:Enkurin superfamily protein n=1 Tax=Giardia muris TaxID=5742 RepID=A0A4Z1T2R4_GIAMU|nr:Enkurin superfamily protein [Giardia muris]|eukprot:TNJ26711.1 Enkurin superfamily protein [Giardia muris]